MELGSAEFQLDRARMGPSWGSAFPGTTFRKIGDHIASRRRLHQTA